MSFGFVDALLLVGELLGTEAGGFVQCLPWEDIADRHCVGNGVALHCVLEGRGSLWLRRVLLGPVEVLPGRVYLLQWRVPSRVEYRGRGRARSKALRSVQPSGGRIWDYSLLMGLRVIRNPWRPFGVVVDWGELRCL